MDFLSTVNRQEREIRGIDIGKEVNLSSFAGGMTLHIGNTKDILRKLLWFINEFSMFSRYKIDIQKYVAFLYNNSKVKVREINEIIPFTMTLKKNKTKQKKN